MKEEELIRKRQELDDIKKDDLNTYNEFLKIIDNNIKTIASFDERNYIDLLVDMYENHMQVFALKDNIKEISELISNLKEEKRILLNKKNMSVNDIINEISDNIMVTYLFSSFAVTCLSKNSLRFLANYVVVMLIGILTFKINLDYFASDKRKKKLAERVDELDYYIDANKYSVDVMQKYYQLFNYQLAYENKKLKEILPPKEENETFEDYIKRTMPFVEKLEFIQVEDNTKKKTLKK